MATWKWSAAECSGATRCTPAGDTMPSPRWTAASLHRTEKSGGLPTTNAADFEFAALGENSMPTACGGNCMSKIPNATDGIEVLHAAKRNLEELRRGARLNLLQIAHPLTCKEAPRSSLQPHCRPHLVGKHLPRRLHHDVWLLYQLRLLSLVLDLQGASAPTEDSIREWVLDARSTVKDNVAGGGR